MARRRQQPRRAAPGRGLRTERHPLIVFREGAAGLRRPALVGTRLYVWQVLDTVRASGNSVADAAAYLGLPEHHVQAAVNYYADFAEEVDEYRAQERAFEHRERERWDRAQRVLGWSCCATGTTDGIRPPRC